MRKRLPVWAWAILPLAVTAALVAITAGGRGPQPPAYAAGEGGAGLAGAYNRLGIELFREMAGAGAPATVFISPASIAFCLGLAYNGAGGGTAAEMAGVLGAAGIDLAAFNAANRELLRGLAAADTAIRLDIANSLWLRDRFPFRQEFVARCREAFGADAFPLTGADAINAWVSERTQRMIPAIVGQIDPRDIAVLVNAIYFKGRWAEPFDPARTRDGTFHAPGGDRPVRLMARGGELPYREHELFQAVRLDYGDGGAAMYVLLPRAGRDLAELRAALTPDAWSEWTARMPLRPGRLELPRLKASHQARLNQALAARGMPAAFSPRADFGRLCACAPGDVLISDVLHKAVVELSEEGTEAAAATAIIMKVTSVSPPLEPFEMIVDRPFLLAIADAGTGLLLFLGQIADVE